MCIRDSYSTLLYSTLPLPYSTSTLLCSAFSLFPVECSRFNAVFDFIFSRSSRKKSELTIPVAKSLCTNAFSQVDALGLPPPIENYA